MTVRLKLFLSHIMAVLLVSGSIGTYFYSRAADSLLVGLQERLQSSAALISHTFDAASLRKIRGAEDASRAEYREALESLRILRRMNPDIAYLYIMRQEAGRIYFVVDSDESAKQASPGQEYAERIPAMLAGFTSVSVDSEIFSDEWGSFLSGYAPLKNGYGEYIIGIDMQADSVDAKYTRLRISGLLSLAAALLLAFLFSHYLASRFVGPIKLAIRRCTDIAQGRLDEKLIIKTGDELEKLMQAFNEMSETLSESEKRKKEAFYALSRSRDELEIRVMQRTADLKEVNNKLSNEIAQRIIAQNALHEAATTDSLTRLLNRRAMLERLEHESTRNQRSQAPFTVLLADLDHFKDVNDLKGHEAGDSVLIEAAVRMKSMLRSGDSLGRWGGEEFVVLLPDTQLREGRELAEKIRGRIGETPFYVAGEEVKVTASVGVAEFDQSLGIRQMLKVVDEALYDAKRKGRDRVEVGSPAPPLGPQQ